MGRVPEKSERRRPIEGEGLKSYCVNLGHTAVIDKYCITSCRSLDRRPPLMGENSCMWGDNGGHHSLILADPWM